MKCSINKQSLQKVKALNNYNKSSESNAKHTRGVWFNTLQYITLLLSMSFNRLHFINLYLKSHAMKTITPEVEARR